MGGSVLGIDQADVVKVRTKLDTSKNPGRIGDRLIHFVRLKTGVGSQGAGEDRPCQSRLQHAAVRLARALSGLTESLGVPKVRRV